MFRKNKKTTPPSSSRIETVIERKEYRGVRFLWVMSIVMLVVFLGVIVVVGRYVYTTVLSTLEEAEDALLLRQNIGIQVIHFSELETLRGRWEQKESLDALVIQKDPFGSK